MSVAELKRKLTPGTVLDVTMHRYSDLTGRRTVVKANSVGVYLTLPDGHPRQAEEPAGSFLDWPKARELTENADGSFTIHFEGWKDALITFTIVQQNKSEASELREGRLVRYTMDNLGCVGSSYIVDAGDTGVYVQPVAGDDPRDKGWHITAVTVPGGAETLVCPVHESMFEPMH